MKGGRSRPVRATGPRPAETLAAAENKGAVAARDGPRVTRATVGPRARRIFADDSLAGCVCSSCPVRRVPEAQLKSIVWQTLQAVNFCHKHNVST